MCLFCEICNKQCSQKKQTQKLPWQPEDMISSGQDHSSFLSFYFRVVSFITASRLLVVSHATDTIDHSSLWATSLSPSTSITM